MTQGSQDQEPQSDILSYSDSGSALDAEYCSTASLFSGSEGESDTGSHYPPAEQEADLDGRNSSPNVLVSSLHLKEGQRKQTGEATIPAGSGNTNSSCAPLQQRGSNESGDASQLAAGDPYGDQNWQSRNKHFFVLSNAGKPIFSRYGSESSLAGFMGVICGMLSFMEASGDEMQTMHAGGHLFVFICRGPMFLVAVSRTGEPAKCLLLQLDLLHFSIISILTNAVERIFHRSPSYDMRQLMGGTGAVLCSLIQSFERDPSAMLVSIPSMPLPLLKRRVLQDTLGGACGPGLAMYAMLLAGDSVVGLAEPKGAPLHPNDVLLVSNFVRSNESFRQAESFSPICLPHFNSAAYLHAYIHYIVDDVCVVLLASQPDAFYRLAASKSKIEATMHSAGVLEEIHKRLENPALGHIDVAELPQSAGGGRIGATSLRHFIYRSPTKRQLVMAVFAGEQLRESVVQAYSALAAQMHDTRGSTVHRVFFSQTCTMTTFATLRPDSELYAVFDPLVEKATACQIASRLTTWIKSKYTELFIPLAEH